LKPEVQEDDTNRKTVPPIFRNQTRRISHDGPAEGTRHNRQQRTETVQRRTEGEKDAELLLLGIRQIFASYNNPKGNAETERVIRTIKEDLVWIREFESVAAFEAALKMWQKAYNEDIPHSSLGCMTPYEYERWFKVPAA